MTIGPYPALGLYWFDNVDPTVGPGMPAPLNQLLIRTDQPSLYYKSGIGDTDWTLLSGGGGAGGVNVQNQGVALPNNPHTTLDFEGANVIATDQGAGVARVTILSPVIYDTDVAKLNIRANRASNNSPIDNTKIQITNFGSQDGTINPGATGVTANGGTIVGGNDNSVSGTDGTAGGAGNTVSSIAGTAFGQLNSVSNDFGTALGNANDVQGIGASAIGDGNTAIGDGSSAIGQGNQATGLAGIAIGQQASATRGGQVAMGAGAFAVVGDAQTTVWAERGETPGLLANEVAVLEGGGAGTQFAVDATMVYMVKLYAVAAGVVHGDSDTDARASFEFPPILAYLSGGVTVIRPTGPIVVSPAAADPDAADWTMEVSAAGGAMVVKFITGSQAAAVRCVASLITSELGLP